MRSQGVGVTTERAAQHIAAVLNNLQHRRQRYSLQLLKQFLLFPDESESSQRTLSKYDILIFSDEQLHTMFRKIQTKLIQNKIWAFLNLRYHRYLLAAKKLEQPMQQIQQRVQKQHKQFTFIQIKTYSEFRAGQEKLKTQNTIRIEQPVTTPLKGKKSQTKIQINVDIRHEIRTSPAHQYLRNSTHKSSTLQPPTQSVVQQQPVVQMEQRRVNYPISQLHPQVGQIGQVVRQVSPVTVVRQVQPMAMIGSVQPGGGSTVRMNRLIGPQQGEAERKRSRSGSIIRYEYDVTGAKKIVVNGHQIPVNIKLNRSESPMEAPQYTVRPPVRVQTTRYQFGPSPAELQKRDSLRYEYQHSNARVDSRLSPRVLSSQQLDSAETLATECGCGQFHPQGTNCNGRRTHKVTRLRSSSKSKITQGGYLEHLRN